MKEWVFETEIKEGIQLLRGMGDLRWSGGQGRWRSRVQKNGKARSEIITCMILKSQRTMTEFGE